LENEKIYCDPSRGLRIDEYLETLEQMKKDYS
jgi:hypothetical protein